MILWTLILAPLGLGSLIWLLGEHLKTDRKPPRALLGSIAVLALLLELILAFGGGTGASASISWGAGLSLSLEVVPMVRVVAIMIPVVSLPILIWATGSEEDDGLPRLLGLLIMFTGVMQMLVLAADLLVLAIAWELLGLLSWALIAHQWHEGSKVAAANYAFNATRLGGLGLWFVAAATVAVDGEFSFEAIEVAVSTPWSAWIACGILAAAASKSAQGPFAPWLFAAMEGPSSVSALLHSSTMVAAGAWLIIRLHEPLSAVTWFGPAAVIIGLATAIAAGVTAIVQEDAKRLLAASTSAQYGLMFIAVGAGYAAAGLVHLVSHAAFKALLFLAAGSVIHLVGSHSLMSMQAGRRLPMVAAASWVGVAALAALPPLGAAWSKEKIIAAAGHHSVWLALATIVAGMLSAWYAMRFQALAFGRKPGDDPAARPLAEKSGPLLLALYTMVLGILWLIGDQSFLKAFLPGELPEGKTWELFVSVGTVVAASLTSWFIYRSKDRSTVQVKKITAEWLGLTMVIEKCLTFPTQALANYCARFDRRFVDRGVQIAVTIARFFSGVIAAIFEQGFDETVRALAQTSQRWGTASRQRIEWFVDLLVDKVGVFTGSCGDRIRTTQTGAIPLYLAFLSGGVFCFFLIFILGVW